MIRFEMRCFYLIVFLSINIAFSSFDDEKNGYYFPSISQKKVSEVEALLEKAEPESLAHLFKKEFLPYIVFGPLEKQPRHDALKKFLILQSFLEVRDKGITEIKEKGEPGWEKKRGFLLSAHKTHGSFEGSFESYEDYLLDEAKSRGLGLDRPKLTEKIDIFFKRYQCTTETLGFQNNTWLRHFINKYLLFPYGADDKGMEQRNFLWSIFKKANLVETQIPDNLAEWTYDSSVAVRQAVDKLKPKVLTLGCGTTTLFNHDDMDIKINDLFGRFPGLVWNCVSCGDLHKDELSVAYQKPIEYEWDVPSEGYDSSSHATVRGNMCDPKLWAALEGTMFDTIKEHTKLLDSPEILPEHLDVLLGGIDRHLISGGTAEFLVSSWSKEKYVAEILKPLLDKGYAVDVEEKCHEENTIKITLSKP